MPLQLGLGLNRLGGFNPFTPNRLNPYLFFDTRTSMLGELESPTLDLDPAVPSSLDVITATRSGVATYTDADGVIQTAPENTVRVDHVDGVPMMLIEPSATNLFRNSQDLTASPNNISKATITEESETFKGQPVFRITDDTSSGEHRLSIFPDSVTASRVIVHFFVKADTCTKFCITYPTTGDAAAAWDLQSGSALGSTVGSAVAQTIEDAGDGWFKVSMTYDRPTATATGHNIQTLQDSATSAANRNYQGDGTLSFLMTMPQLEYGETQTSFIPTSGSTVTRAADNLVIDGSAFSDFYNQSEGTFYVEFLPKDATAVTFLYEVSDTASERIYSRVDSQHIRVFDSVVQADIDAVAASSVTMNRLAASFKQDNFKVALNGTAGTPDVSGSVPAVTFMNIGSNYAGGNQLNGHIKRLIYWPTHSDSL